MLFIILCLTSTNTVSQGQSYKRSINIAINFGYIEVIFIPLTELISIKVKFSEVYFRKPSFQSGVRLIIENFFDTYKNPPKSL